MFYSLTEDKQFPTIDEKNAEYKWTKEKAGSIKVGDDKGTGGSTYQAVTDLGGLPNRVSIYNNEVIITYIKYGDYTNNNLDIRFKKQSDGLYRVYAKNITMK